MTTGVLPAMEPTLHPEEEDDHTLEQHFTRQIGCVTGFFHLFDRHHSFPSRRPTSSKRLPPSPEISTPAPSDRSDGSPRATPSPDPPRSSLPAFDFQEGHRSIWKLRDSPRLSLDSRIVPREIRTVPRPGSDDGDPPGRSPGVVARLMGLGDLPPELRRSSSVPRLATPAPPPPPPPPPPATTEPPRKRDLEMLKEVLEAMQLKGLLRPANDFRRRDPIVIIRPPPPQPSMRREMVSDKRPRRDRKPPSAKRTPSPVAKARAAVSIPRRSRVADESARSPRPRKTRGVAYDDSGSPFDDEKECPQRESMESRNGRRLLDRCDKLLQSIAEITDGGGLVGGCAESSSSGRQTSPVSVLESATAFFGEDGTAAEASPPSPAFSLKRCLNFEDRVVKKEVDPCLEPVDAIEASDGDFRYVAKVLAISDQTTMILNDEAFYILEKEHQPSSKAACLHRRLVFDTVAEIVERKKRSIDSRSTLTQTLTQPRQVWEEVKWIREHPLPKDDLYVVVYNALRKDIIGRGGEERRSRPCEAVELSDVVLDVERLIYKDLVADAIRDLSTSNRRSSSSSISRRKLVF